MLDALKTELGDLDRAEQPTDEQLARMDAAIAEHDTFQAELDTLEARRTRADAILNSPTTTRTNGFNAPTVLTRQDPFFWGVVARSGERR